MYGFGQLFCAAILPLKAPHSQFQLIEVKFAVLPEFKKRAIPASEHQLLPPGSASIRVDI